MRSNCLFQYATLIIAFLLSKIWMSAEGKKIRINVTITSNSLLKYISFLNDPCDDFYYFSCEGWIYRRHLEMLLEKKRYSDELYNFNSFFYEAMENRKYDNKSKVIKNINDMFRKCSTLDPELVQVCYSSVSEFGTYAFASYFIHRLENNKIVQEGYKIVKKMFHEIINEFKLVVKEKHNILDKITIKNYIKKINRIKFNRNDHKNLGDLKMMEKCYSYFKFSNKTSGQALLNNIFNYESLLPKNDTKLRKTCVDFIVRQRTSRYGIFSLISYNAHFQPFTNNVVINPSILVDPCFDIRFPMSLNYGCVGVIIGHEIVHGFDAIGIHFDDNGKISQNITSKESRKRYKEKSDCLGKQYTNETLKQFGNDYRKFRVLDENIADNGGIKIAYRAYLKYLKKIGGKESIIPRLEKFTGKQLFFVNWARFFCSLNNHPINMNNATHRVHFPGSVRVRNTLSNYKPFSEAYKCKIGTKMNPRDSCEVWM
uniref:Phosphate-regulating neutral endopeptidase (inferred by orthology to a human protein) n=1 Tax=Strongyloides venezuelensis TaxID=75913 RepID=A0A0K0EU60_STRVS